MTAAKTLRFKITTGPYDGNYDIDPDDFTGTEVNRFRQALGLSITAGLAGGTVDLDVLCGLVWIVKSRQAKGLPYGAVADNVHRSAIDLHDEDAATEDDPLDPTPSGDG